MELSEDALKMGCFLFNIAINFRLFHVSLIVLMQRKVRPKAMDRNSAKTTDTMTTNVFFMIVASKLLANSYFNSSFNVGPPLR